MSRAGLPLLSERSRLTGILAVIAAIVPEAAHAQSESVLQDYYLKFKLGFDTVASDLPVLLLVATIAHLLALHQEIPLKKLWPFLLLGIGVGGILGASALIPAVFPALIASVLVGSLTAISVRISFAKISIGLAIVGIVLANASLSGYAWQQIHLVTYLGMFCGIILATMIVIMPIRLSLVLLHYTWVPIIWRATASWLVAIAVLLIALRLAYPPSDMQNWFERWANP